MAKRIEPQVFSPAAHFFEPCPRARGQEPGTTPLVGPLARFFIHRDYTVMGGEVHLQRNKGAGGV